MLKKKTKKRKPTETPDQKEKRRERYLRRIFGIGISEYTQLLEQQDYRCAICRRPEETFTNRLGVDHCHTTGEIRGLLCPFCNQGLSTFNDDPAYFDRAAAYLRQGTGWKVPEKYRVPKRKRRRKIRRKS